MQAQWLFLLQNLEKKQKRLKYTEWFSSLPGFKTLRKRQLKGIKKIKHDISTKKQEILKMQREDKIYEIISPNNKIDSIKKGTGWLKEPDDDRDHDAPEPLSALKSPSVTTAKYQSSYIIPQSEFTPIKNQKSLGSCTAHAGCAQLEYYIKRKTNKNVNLSELFLYLETRRNLGWELEDTGAYLRTTMKTMVSIGICLEKYWPYKIKKFTENPPAFIYPRADDYKVESYFKLDKRGYTKKQVLSRIKSALNKKLPLTFGFTCYESALTQARKTGQIPFPSAEDEVSGGHAVLLVGYDDNMIIKNTQDDSETIGAFIFRNSWGKRWGDKGRGYLPYDYLLKGHLDDIWCLFRADYLDESRFN